MKNITIKIPYRATVSIEPQYDGDIEVEIENDNNQLPLALINALIGVEFKNGALSEFLEDNKDEVLSWVEEQGDD